MSAATVSPATFADLNLPTPIARAIAAEGYENPTPIQAQAIPPAVSGRDLLGSAQTGTGKTAAFAIPMLARLGAGERTGRVRGLVLCPTRELALQIADSFKAYGRNLPLRHAVIFGGVSQNKQVAALRGGADIIIATPGRLMDLMEQGHVHLGHVELFVLDEADRMLDMGFIRDIRKIAAELPQKRQTLLFSATMPPAIRQLADSLMKNPVRVEVAPTSKTAERIEQSVYYVEKANKPQLLAHLVDALPMSRAIVFTRTKHGADRVVRQLDRQGIAARAIHGNKSQNARNRALDEFRRGKVGLLIATDVAARGIDVEGITHVVNFDLTNEPETYVHRIGRTARAGAAGSAVAFCDRDEISYLRAIERLTKERMAVRDDHPEYLSGGEPFEPAREERRESRQPQRNRSERPAAATGRHQNASARPAARSVEPRREAQPSQASRNGKPQWKADRKPDRPQQNGASRDGASRRSAEASGKPKHPASGGGAFAFKRVKKKKRSFAHAGGR